MVLTEEIECRAVKDEMFVIPAQHGIKGNAGRSAAHVECCHAPLHDGKLPLNDGTLRLSACKLISQWGLYPLVEETWKPPRKVAAAASA